MVDARAPRLIRVIRLARSYRRTIRIVAAVLGVLLLLAAIVMIARQREVIDAARAALHDPDWRLVAMLAGAIVGNYLLSGLMFSVLIRPFGRVGLLEMQAVVAAASLINFLPLRPGPFGRVAYHTVVNRIPVRDATRVMIEGVVMTIIAAVLLAVTVGLSRFAGTTVWIMALTPAVLLASMTAIDAPRRRILLALLLRYLDVMLWAIRYIAAFALLGRELGLDAALALATISVIATMVPFFSNGLGLREWAVGLVAPLITAHQLELGLTAELINRAVEIVMVLILGGIAIGWLTWWKAVLPRILASPNGTPPPDEENRRTRG